MVINVDVTVFYNGYHGDCSEMFMVGEVDQAGKNLVQVLAYLRYSCNLCTHGPPDERGYSALCARSV